MSTKVEASDLPQNIALILVRKCTYHRVSKDGKSVKVLDKLSLLYIYLYLSTS